MSHNSPSKAIDFAREAHAGQLDKQGRPYIDHCLRVRDHLRYEPDYVRVAAVLHDTLEDTDTEYGDLVRAGFDQRAVMLVDALTRRPKEYYSAYIARLAQVPYARKIKLADIADNLDRERGDYPHLRKRYLKARAYLMDGADEMFKPEGD